MDIPATMIFGMMQGIGRQPFFFVLGACIVAITACVVVKMRVVDIRCVIVGVLGLAALALLCVRACFRGLYGVDSGALPLQHVDACSVAQAGAPGSPGPSGLSNAPSGERRHR
jgi:hypothetical protein